MRIGFFGGLAVTDGDRLLSVAGTMQLAVLFRLALDAGRVVSYRAIVEDVWSRDAPENERAALQSVVSRLRSQLPPGAIESSAGGYRLAVSRADVDTLAFEDLVAAAAAADAEQAQRLASQALALWTGEPWIPSPNFDWVERDLLRDRATALRLGGVAPVMERTQRSTIPVPLTSFVGRESELEMIRAQLAASRLVTIVGTGGAGKTRLAIETALRIPGSVLVELAPAGPGELLAAVLAGTGRELRTETLAPSGGALERVIDALDGRDVLVVLDNCEHVVGEAADLADRLLRALPRLRILATSREPLAIAGEAFVAVGSLAHPSTGAEEGLLAFPAVELFRQRALAARGADLENDEIRLAALICARLDGLPLAIELAAARLRTMSPQEVLDGLENRFTLLTGGFRTALPRHQTLRAMIDWSWSLLGDDERAALARLAVFPAGVDAGDVPGLASAMGLSAAVFDSLVDKSLLQRSRGRYRALETVREYGVERLAEQGTTIEARMLQAAFERDRAREVDRLLRGPGIGAAIAWFDAEEDNISSALRFAVAEDLGDVAVDLATACTWYWIIRDRQDDARVWLELVMPLAAKLSSPEAVMLRLVEPITTAFSAASDETDPREIFRRSSEVLVPLASIELKSGTHDLVQVFVPVLKAFAAVIGEPDWMVKVELPRGEELGLDPWPIALIHVMRAATAQNRGDVEELGAESAIAHRMFTEVGDLWGLALSSQMRAEWLIVTGRLEEALVTSDEATRDLRSITSSWDLAQQQGQAITALTRMGRLEDARLRAEAVIAEALDSGNPRAHLQAQSTAAFVDFAARDLESLDRRLTIIDGLADAWSTPPQQSTAQAAVLHAGAELLRGRPDAAEGHLRTATSAALASHDLPIIGGVAVSLGSLALARGDIPTALRAVDLATALIGVYDGTDPQIVAIERAAADAGIGRPGAEALTRPKALAALQEIAEGR